MSRSRLSLALDDAGPLPGGRVLVLRPAAETDLTFLPRGSAQIVAGFRPDHDAWAARGFAVAPEAAGAFAAALVFVPRARALAQALVAEAAARVAPGGPVWVDGQKTDGVDPLFRAVRARVAVEATVSKAHGRAFLFRTPGPGAFADWAARDGTPLPGFVTRPGVFSADGVDPGSALLAAQLPADLKGRGADLGAGWGWLAAQVLTRPAVTGLHLVEAEAEALACARRNLPDGRAHFHWADATRFRPEAALDFVVMNPPFHHGRAADPGLGAAFIRAAQGMLAPAGRLWLVANRGLPYEQVLAAGFGQVATLASEGGFKVLTAAHPRKARR